MRRAEHPLLLRPTRSGTLDTDQQADAQARKFVDATARRTSMRWQPRGLSELSSCRSADGLVGADQVVRIEGLSPARGPNDGDPGQCLSEEGDSRPSSRARFTASARLCTPSLAYTLRKWVLIVFSDTNSSAAISGAGRLVDR
jgi:hypothetical protein